MFGFFRHVEQAVESPELSFECILEESSECTQAADPSFERILVNASQLRKAVLTKMDGLSSGEKTTVLCYIHDLSLHLHKLNGVPPETLPFGSLHPLPHEKVADLIVEIGRCIDQERENGNGLGVLAAAYCQSMAMACLAGSMEVGLEQELKFINLKHELGQQTGRFMDSLECA